MSAPDTCFSASWRRAGLANLATKDDVLGLRGELVGRMDSLEERMTSRMESLEHRFTASSERLARRLVMWTASMVLASAALAFAAGRFV
jgi:hypothetical protein